MRSPGVVIGDVLVQHATKVVLIEDDHLIKALFAYRTHPALGVAIGIRCVIGDIYQLHAFRLKHDVKRRGNLVS
jgi:hypothetical protein